MIAPNAREVNLDLSRLIAQAGRLASFHEARARRHRAIERALLALVERGQP